ncbi:acyltransferase family protein [Luteimonas mephitis]|uniref:acyltransferase family protein n=1 Tax=Luteimonas mephitis TaxID=83615 RepID=UPI003A928C74
MTQPREESTEPRPLAARAPNLPLHIPSIDGMRAISIAMVLVAHSASTQNVPAVFDIPVFTSLGNVGVRFFFVISGFLITTLLLRDVDRYGRIRLPVFYTRRMLRIMPAAMAYIWAMWCLYLFGVIDLRFQSMSETEAASAVPGLLHALTFTYNYTLDYSWYYNHLWSLSVEEQFYLLWPFVLVYLGVARGTRVALGALLVVPVVRLLMHLYGDTPELALSRHFQAVCDSVATGCLGALFYNRLADNRLFVALTRWPAIPLGGLCIAVGYGIAFVSRPAAYVFGQSLANLGIIMLLLHVIRHPHGVAGCVLNSRPFVAVGILSYSLYLWQEPFLYFRGEGWATAFPQNLALAFAAALCSYYLVERPFLALKDRIGARKRIVVAPASGVEQVPRA